MYYKAEILCHHIGFDLWTETSKPNILSLYLGNYQAFKDKRYIKISEAEFNRLKEEYVSKAVLTAKQLFSNRKYTDDFTIQQVQNGLVLTYFTLEVNEEVIHNTRCFDPVKVSGDIILQVPDWRLKLFGYEKEEFEEYLNFLKKVAYLQFSWEEELETEGGKDNISETMVTDTIMFPKHRIYRYKIGNRDRYYNYIHALLVRYAIHPNYRNIARYCLEMRKVLPKKVTNSEILLLAHYSGVVDNFYALTSYSPNISQKFSDIIDKYSKGKKLNDCIDRGPIVSKISDYFKNKKFKELYKLVK